MSPLRGSHLPDTLQQVLASQREWGGSCRFSNLPRRHMAACPPRPTDAHEIQPTAGDRGQVCSRPECQVAPARSPPSAAAPSLRTGRECPKEHVSVDVSDKSHV